MIWKKGSNVAERIFCACCVCLPLSPNDASGSTVSKQVKDDVVAIEKERSLSMSQGSLINQGIGMKEEEKMEF